MTIKEIETKSMMAKSNLPVSDFSVNTYVGCAHACKYCYASFMKRFTNHCEPPRGGQLLLSRGNHPLHPQRAAAPDSYLLLNETTRQRQTHRHHEHIRLLRGVAAA